MNETPPDQPAPPEGAKPQPTGEEPFTPARLFLNILAGILAAVTMAPIGILHLTGAVKFFSAPICVLFWAGFLITAGYASLTPKRDVGAGLTFLLFLISLLNVGGCASVLGGFSSVT